MRSSPSVDQRRRPWTAPVPEDIPIGLNVAVAARVDQLLREASEVLGCEAIAIRCDCENLETVYVEREDDQIVITDRGETYGYLSRGTDNTYDLTLLSDENARSICARHGVDFDVTSDAELLPRISRPIGEANDVPGAVQAVAAAIDEIFEAALQPGLRRR